MMAANSGYRSSAIARLAPKAAVTTTNTSTPGIADEQSQRLGVALRHHRVERVPIDHVGERDDGRDDRSDDDEPDRQPAQEQRRSRTGKRAVQVAVAGVAHLVALQARLRPRISEPERHDGERPPQQRKERITPGRAVLIEPHPAEHRAGQPVAARPIQRELAEQHQQQKADRRNRGCRGLKRQRRGGDRAVERTDDGDGDQKTAEELGGKPGIFQRLAADLGIAPQITPHVGREPEAINAEREREQRGALGAQPPIGRFLAEKIDRARGLRHQGIGRRHDIPEL